MGNPLITSLLMTRYCCPHTYLHRQVSCVDRRFGPQQNLFNFFNYLTKYFKVEVRYKETADVALYVTEGS